MNAVADHDQKRGKRPTAEDARWRSEIGAGFGLESDQVKMPRGLRERVGEQAVLGYTRRGRRIGEVDLGSDGAQSRSGTGVERTVDC